MKADDLDSLIAGAPDDAPVPPLLVRDLREIMAELRAEAEEQINRWLDGIDAL